jgi:hypothetical protein
MLLVGAVMTAGSTKSTFTRHQRAFYLDPAVGDFVRPGVVVKITGAHIATDGTITVNYSLTDPAGLPLDLTGVSTPGPVNGSLTVAWLPNGQNQYVNYLASVQTNTTTGATFTNPSDEDILPGQTQNTGPGQYTFTFMGKAPSGFDVTATQSVGIYVSRDLTQFGLNTYSADDIFSWVPNGAAVTHIHDEIRTQTCNKCHAPLAAHELRHTLNLCALCHTAGAGNPDTGNSVDLKVFIHKIHMGSQLPSVIAGTPYQIITFHGTSDFSNVVFPADPQNCTFCHEGGVAQAPNSGQPGQGGLGAPADSTITQGGAPSPEVAGATTGTGTALVNPPGAACGSADNPGCNAELLPWPPVEANYWLTHPSVAACGACHDDVNFATGVNHPGGPQPDDNQCHNCHIPQGELPFDASILGAHTIPTFAPGLPGVVFKLLSVDGGAAGAAPLVTYTLNDKSGKPIDPSTMNFLNLVMNGPTGDYTTAVTESAIKGSTGSSGTYQYQFVSTVPAGATGTYTIGIEGYKNATLLAGTTSQQAVRDAGFNDLIDFSVDGSTVAPHPIEVSQAQCNSCHFALALHGGIRQNVQYCLLCHNPTATDSSQRPTTENPPQTIDLPILVHRIHLGTDSQFAAPNGVAQYLPFIVWGFGKQPNDLSNVEYPGTLNQCQKCHINESQEVPPPATRINVITPRAYINPAPPTTAACTACHIAKSASAHALAETDSLGESCDVCHGPGAAFAVDKVHAQ